MVREQTFEKLYSLKLHGFAQALQQQLADSAASSLGFEERVAMLVDAQWLWRENRAVSTRLRKAHLKHAASMEDINYRHHRELDRSLMRSLASCEWVNQHHNITSGNVMPVHVDERTTNRMAMDGYYYREAGN